MNHNLLIESTVMLEPVGMEGFASGFIGALVGVGTKVVTLGLGQVLRQAITSVAVEVVKRGAKCRNGNSQFCCRHQHFSPRILTIENGLLKLRSQQQVRQGRILVKGVLNSAQKSSSNDTATLPDASTFAQIHLGIKQRGRRFAD